MPLAVDAGSVKLTLPGSDAPASSVAALRETVPRSVSEASSVALVER